MEVWPVTMIFMIFIASSQLYKLTEDEVETTVTSKPINFGTDIKTFDEASESTLTDAIPSFKPSKELFLFSAKDFEKYQFNPDELKSFSSTNGGLSRQFQSPENFYKQWLMLNTKLANYDLEQNERDSKEINTNNHKLKESLVYGKRKPVIDFFGKKEPFDFNSFDLQPEKYNGHIESNYSKIRHHPFIFPQENVDPTPQQETVDLYEQFAKINTVPHNFEKYSNKLENFYWQQQKYNENPKDRKPKPHNKQMKGQNYRYKKGLEEYEHSHNVEKKKLRKPRYRDHYRNSNPCNVRN